MGTALLSAAMDWFKRRGIGSVEAFAPSANHPLRGFFRALGFRESAQVLLARLEPDPAAALVST